MQPQPLANLNITIPTDCLPLVTDLISRLGGHVAGAETCGALPVSELERGGKMLKGLRQRAGLTQKEVAAAIGVPQSHISEYEKNKRAIPYKHAEPLARLLRTIPSHFMTPNAETLAAMKEAAEQGAERFTSSDALFEDLGI